MPLDLGRLRHDLQLQKLLQESLEARHHKQNDSNSSSLSVASLLALDPALRQASGNLERARHEDNSSRRRRQQEQQQQRDQQQQSSTRVTATTCTTTDASSPAVDVDVDSNATDSITLAELESAYQQAQERLQLMLERFPNYVDLHASTILSSLEKEEEAASSACISITTTKTKTIPPEAQTPSPLPPDDPFFCIGGYDHVGTTNNNSKNNPIVLTSIGLSLMRWLEQSFLDWAQQELFLSLLLGTTTSNATGSSRRPGKVMVWEVPSVFPSTSASSSSSSKDQLPSWRQVLEQTYGAPFARGAGSQRTYYDRNLPLLHVLLCRDNKNNSNHHHRQLDENSTDHTTSSTTTTESAAAARVAEGSDKKKKQKKKAWYQRLATTTAASSSTSSNIQVLILTGSWHNESQRVQIQCMQETKRFYQQQLLPQKTTTTIATEDATRTTTMATPAGVSPPPSVSSSLPSLQLRFLDPTELEPDEASRLVLETTTTKSSSTATYCTTTSGAKSSRRDHNHHHEPMVLASLSNYLDFYSTGMRHGSSSSSSSLVLDDDDEFDDFVSSRKRKDARVHVLHGQLSPCLLECLDWIVRTAARAPAPPQQALGSSGGGGGGAVIHQQFYPYLRKVIRNKKGLDVVMDLSTEQSQQSAGERTGSKRSGSSNRKMTKSAGGTTSTSSATSSSRPSPDEIRLEARSCPFDFLPFYYR